VLTDTVLLDAPRFVDQSFEDAPHGVAVERLRRLATQAIEHISLAIRVVYREVVVAFELTDGEDHFHAFSDELQDAAIQIVDASP